MIDRIWFSKEAEQQPCPRRPLQPLAKRPFLRSRGSREFFSTHPIRLLVAIFALLAIDPRCCQAFDLTRFLLTAYDTMGWQGVCLTRRVKQLGRRKCHVIAGFSA